MATRTTVALEDDLEGGPADETVHFSFAGAEYEIDLSKENASRFRKELAPFVTYARAASRGRRRPARPASTRQRSADIRAWAKEQGIGVSDRGRIPVNVIERYEATAGGR